MASSIRFIALAAVLFVAAIAAGCSPRAVGPRSGVELLETECERSLHELDALIETREREHTVGPAALEEARELRRAAAELCLLGHGDVALELIDDALSLLRTTT